MIENMYSFLKPSQLTHWHLGPPRFLSCKWKWKQQHTTESTTDSNISLISVDFNLHAWHTKESREDNKKPSAVQLYGASLNSVSSCSRRVPGLLLSVKNKRAIKINAYAFCFLSAGRDEYLWLLQGKTKKTFSPSLFPLCLASCHHLLIDWLVNDVLVAANCFDGKWWADILSGWFVAVM